MIKRLTFIACIWIATLSGVHAQSYEELKDIFVSGAYTLSRNQVKYTPPVNFELVKGGKEYLECLHSEQYIF